MRVCVREREREIEKERDSVCVCAREREIMEVCSVCIPYKKVGRDGKGGGE